MPSPSIIPLNEESTFGNDETIVSKTDTKGKILYVNDVFCRISEMTTKELIERPHSIIRHPDMPRVIFKLLWEAVRSGTEIFAYIKNMSKSGRYYWVVAHVTPSFDNNRQIIGFHSNRRSPPSAGVSEMKPIYQSLLEEEKKHSNPKEGLDASSKLFQNILGEKNQSYSEFIWSLRS